VTFSEDGYGSAGHDVAIVVIGETPYAEWLGDDADLALDHATSQCLNRIGDIPTVVVLVSGRPLMISDRLGGWDAFVAAWLPGTEGDGVAEVLFGEHDFTGKLPHSWPDRASGRSRSMSATRTYARCSPTAMAWTTTRSRRR
jgi:beta-glucosidase